MNIKPGRDRLTSFKSTLLCLALLLFVLGLAANARAQVTFVHLTDPHIFDDDWEPKDDKDPKKDPKQAEADRLAKVEDNRLDNQAALESCLWNINERIKYGEKFDFGVITGDLGIEYLVKDFGTPGVDDNVIDKRLNDAAIAFARMLELSRIRVWLFVPGNNDVLCEKPANISYYHRFVKKLKSAFDVIDNDPAKRRLAQDLCPEDKGGHYSTVDPFRLGNHVFIGFNDSSFKNSDPDRSDPDELKRCPEDHRITAYAVNQKEYIHQVESLLQSDPALYAYVFYHIPEIDDPYFVTLADNQTPVSTRLANKAAIGNSYYYSAWYVRTDVRAEWNKVVMDPKVRGLFAGHFHDNKKESYLGFQWLKTTTYLPDTLSKLHVAPPLALKVQYDKRDRARGFQEVYIDGKGEVSSRIVWLTDTGWGLANDVAAKENESSRQLELGTLYATNGQLKEAEMAYGKAAESTWPPTRQRAMTAAAEVIRQQNSVSEKYFYVPVRAALATAATTGVSIVVTFFILAVVILVATPYARDYGRWRGRNTLRITATANENDLQGAGFQQVLIAIHGRMSSHYSRRQALKVGRPPLPMLFGSQTGELADLAEAVAPGAVGKVIGWLIKRTDSPEYTLVGMIQYPPDGHGKRRNPEVILVALSERGTTLRTWHATGEGANVGDEEIRLAFRSLKYLMRRQNP